MVMPNLESTLTKFPFFWPNNSNNFHNNLRKILYSLFSQRGNHASYFFALQIILPADRLASRWDLSL